MDPVRVRSAVHAVPLAATGSPSATARATIRLAASSPDRRSTSASRRFEIRCTPAAAQGRSRASSRTSRQAPGAVRWLACHLTKRMARRWTRQEFGRAILPTCRRAHGLPYLGPWPVCWQHLAPVAARFLQRCAALAPPRALFFCERRDGADVRPSDWPTPILTGLRHRPYGGHASCHASPSPLWPSL